MVLRDASASKNKIKIYMNTKGHENNNVRQSPGPPYCPGHPLILMIPLTG